MFVRYQSGDEGNFAAPKPSSNNFVANDAFADGNGQFIMNGAYSDTLNRHVPLLRATLCLERDLACILAWCSALTWRSGTHHERDVLGHA